MNKYEANTISKTHEKVKFEKPKNYKIIILNDDFSTMEFVVMLLHDVFEKELSEAMTIMLNVHQKGKSSVGIYPKKIAEHYYEKAQKYIHNYNEEEKLKSKNERHLMPLQLKLEEE